MVVYMKIDLHFGGTFTRYPIITYSYSAEQRFGDVDFVRMDNNQFLMFVQRFADDKCMNVYYCMPNIEFPHGLRIIVDDSNYMDFIEVGYACGYVVSVNMDNLGANLSEWLEDEQDEVCSSEDNLYGVGEAHEELQGDIDIGIDIDDL